MATTDRVGIEIDILGYQEAVNKMEALERRMRGLNKRKAYLQIQARVKDLQKNLLGLRSHKVKIQADIRDADKQIQRLKDRIRRLNNARMRVMDEGSLNKIDGRIRELQNRLKTLSSQRVDLKTNLGQVNGEIAQTTAEMNRLKAAMQQVKSMSLGQIFKRVSSSVGHVGQAMQSIGNAITRASYPMRMLTSGVIFGAGYSAIGKITEGLSSGFQRYDIMKKYPRLMKQFETDTYSAKKSIDDLDKSVRGLPTGLDEIVNLSQRFTMTTGDMERGTQLAIATNNAFLASMSTETQRYQGMMQLQDIIGGKELRAQEWNSLAKAISPAIRMMGEELGYTGEELNEYVGAVQRGEIANEDFVDALIKAGTSTEDHMGKIAKAAEYSKDTWDAFFSNFKIAFSRLSAGVIETIDELTRATTGKDLNMLLSETVPKKIDKLAGSIKGWIKANPDKITDFFNKLKSVDWKGIGKGMVDGIGMLIEVVEKIAGLFKGNGGANLLGKGLVLSGFVGSGLTILGGILKGSRHIIGGLATMGVGLGRLFTGAGAVLGAGALAKIGKGIADFVGKIKNLGKVKGATSTTALALQKADKKMGTIKGSFASIVSSLSGLATVAGGVLIVGGTVWASVKMIKDIMKDLGDISVSMKDIDPKALAVVGGALGGIVGVVNKAMKGGGLLGMTGALTTKGGLKALAYVEGAILAVGTLVTTVSGFAWANVKIIESTLGNVKKAVGYVSDIATGINELNGVEVNAAGMTSTVGAIAQAMLDIDGTTEDYGEGRWFDNAKIKKMKKKFGNISDMIGLIKRTGNDLKKISEIKDLEGAGGTIAKVIGQMETLYDTLDSKFDVQTKKDIKGTEKGKTILDNVSAMLETIRGTVDDIKALSKTKIDFKGAEQSISQIGTKMGDLYNALYDSLSDPISTAQVAASGVSKAGGGKTREVGTGGGINKKTVERSGFLNQIMTSISETIGTIKEVYDLINKGGFKEVDSKGFKQQLDNAEQMIVDISAMWSRASMHLEKFKQTKNAKTDMANVYATIKSIGQIMTELSSIGQGLQAGQYGDALGDGEGSFPQLGQGLPQKASPTSFIDVAIKNIEGIIDGVQRMATKLTEIPDITTLSAKMEQVRLSIEKVKEISATLNTLGGEGGALATTDGAAFLAINNIETLIEKLGTALNTEVLASLQEKVDTFKQSITDMFTALNEDFSNVEVKVQIKGEVTGHDELVARVQSADAQIRAAVSAIKSYYYKSITVELHGSVTRTGNFGGGLYPHTGGLATSRGLLYRKRGGDAPFGFKPRGTDTIPAMLTPGEYVHRKKAVDFWGVNMMRAINNMDVAGAMRAMSAKAGRVVNGVRNTVINNNTTNNNTANITQNIRTNNPNFAFRRSNRYVGAL